MHVEVGDGRIHSFTGAINAKSESSANLLSSLNVGIRVLQSTNLEYVGVIPSLSESRVREDKPCGFVEGKKSLLVLQDKVVCRDIVGDIRSSCCSRVNLMTFLVDGEISLVNLCGGVSLQVLNVRSVKEGDILVHDARVFFLEDLAVKTVDFVSVLVVLSVLRNLVDKEERENLDSTVEEFFFLLKVRTDSFSYLYSSDIPLGNVAVSVTKFDNLAVKEGYSIGKGVNLTDNETVILFHLV